MRRNKINYGHIASTVRLVLFFLIIINCLRIKETF